MSTGELRELVAKRAFLLAKRLGYSTDTIIEEMSIIQGRDSDKETMAALVSACKDSRLFRNLCDVNVCILRAAEWQSGVALVHVFRESNDVNIILSPSERGSIANSISKLLLITPDPTPLDNALSEFIESVRGHPSVDVVVVRGAEYQEIAIEPRQTSFHVIPDDVIASAIETVLWLGRPLRHYHASFCLPIDIYTDAQLRGEDKSKVTGATGLADLFAGKQRTTSTKIIASRDAAGRYFIPALRSRLYCRSKYDDKEMFTLSDGHPMGYEVDEIDALNWFFGLPEHPESTGKITRLQLVRTKDNLLILCIDVAFPDELQAVVNQSSLIRDDETWWHDLVFSDQTQFGLLQGAMADHWLRYTKLVRVIYTAIKPKDYEVSKVADVLLKREGDYSSKVMFGSEPSELSPVVRELLAEFVDANRVFEHYRHRSSDENMFSHIGYALSGQIPRSEASLEHFQRLFSIALSVEESENVNPRTGHCYDREFVLQNASEHVLKRWCDRGTLIGYTHSMAVFMGLGREFSNRIVTEVVPGTYLKLTQLALFHRLTFDHLNRILHIVSNRVVGSERTEVPIPGVLHKTNELRQQLEDYTNKYWFGEDTTEMLQGKELIALQSAALGLNRRLDLVNTRVNSIDSIATESRRQALERRLNLLGIYALLLAIFAVLPVIDTIFNWIPCLAGSTKYRGLVALVVIAAVLLLGVRELYVWRKERLSVSRRSIADRLRKATESTGRE